MPEPDPLQADAELLFDAVRQAGTLAMTMLRQRLRRWSKADGTPVTEADMKVDALLAGMLRTRRPGYGWLSEESQDDQTRTARDFCWVADPIDGTRSFALGGAHWCVAAALVHNGRPVLAAVYQPVTEEFYSAIAGHGARLNGTRLSAGDGDTLKGAKVIGNRSSVAPLKADGIAADTSGELPLLLRLAHVAAGRADAAVSIGMRSDWDLAAGDLLVHEAGGLVSDLAGQRYVFNRKQTWQHGMIAAGRRRHALIHGRLEKA